MSRWSNGIVTIHATADSSPINLLAQNINFTLNSQVVQPDAGYAYSKLARLIGQAPRIGFETEDLYQILSNIGLLGKCITSDGSHPGLVVKNQRHDSCAAAGRSTASVHQSITMGAGHIFIDTVTASGDRAATASLTGHAATTSLTAPPTAELYNIALPAQPTNQAYIAGPCKVAGIMLPQGTQYAIDYNPKFEAPMYFGSIWPSLIDPQKVEAVIRFTHDDVELFAEAGAGKFLNNGTTAIHATSYVQLRHLNTIGGPVDPATASHIKGTFYGLVTVSTPYQASGQGAANQTLEVACLDDATNAPIVWTMDQALLTS